MRPRNTPRHQRAGSWPTRSKEEVFTKVLFHHLDRNALCMSRIGSNQDIERAGLDSAFHLPVQDCQLLGTKVERQCRGLAARRRIRWVARPGLAITLRHGACPPKRRVRRSSSRGNLATSSTIVREAAFQRLRFINDRITSRARIGHLPDTTRLSGSIRRGDDSCVGLRPKQTPGVARPEAAPC